MPSQREIRRRITSVRNIKQITRAMQFVAASKLKRAQDATLHARPYSEKLDEVLADLAAVLARWGNRGYRLVNLEAGLIGGRLYLGAYGQRFGASGLTFYDRAVVEFFSPRAAGRDALFVTALGRSRPRPAPRS